MSVLFLCSVFAEFADRAVSQHDFQAEDVIARNAVFQAAWTAGIGGDVTAEGIVRAAGRIGRIKESEAFALVLKFGGIHCWLDRRRQNPSR